MGARTYAIAGLNDEEFDLLLAQKGVFDDEVKSFIDYDEQLIVVRNRLSPDHRSELVIHELIHACIEDSGMQQDERIEAFVTALSPRINSLFAEGLASVMREVHTYSP